jgi:predicted phage baseplate assembly protein
VRLVLADPSKDEAFTNVVPGGKLTPRLNPADPALPLLHVRWQKKYALPFTLCVSAQTIEGQPIDPVAVARGNVTPSDHGRTITRDSAKQELTVPDAGTGRWPLPSLSLPMGPLTHQSMPAEVAYNSDGVLLMGRFELDQDVRQVTPAVVLKLAFADGRSEIWTPLPHLLDCGSYDQNFVAEVDNDGRATLRFGDDDYARRPTGVVNSVARFRIGNERSGNIGAETLVHVVAPDPAEPLDPANPGAPLFFAAVERVYQPSAAQLGTDAETIEQVRQFAPEAFRAIQFRAVTESDWNEVALRNPDVAAARASFHWTGSWYTVFVAINPSDAVNLERLPGGGLELTPQFATAMLAWLTRFKLAGYDLVVRAATFVPLEIDVQLCVARGYFRGDVIAAVTRILSNRSFADGTRGFFHRLSFGFGEAVYLSRLYAALDHVAGLDSATVTVFKRYWEVAGDELKQGLISMGAFEIPRLDNDPSSPEDGVLRLIAVGGL